MAILTEPELPIYAPDVTLTGPALTAAIAMIQLTLEGPKGAQRPLELTEFTEIIPINFKLQTAQLSYWPIAQTPEPAIEVRFGNVQNRFRNPLGLSDWFEVQDPVTYLDATGQINFSRSSVLVGNFSRLSNATELRAVYTAGFDFAVGSTDPAVIAIKAIAGFILDYQQNDPSALGVTTYAADDEGRFTLRSSASVRSGSGSSGSANIADNAAQVNNQLASLHKYRPRGVI